jgi:hypothetical protein
VTTDGWLVVKVGGAPHCWPVGDTSDGARVREVIDRARVLVGFPAGDGWLADPARNTVQLTCGQPHEQLMAQATVHRLSDLDTVTVEALTAYQAACDVDTSRMRMAAAKETMLALTSDERTQVIAEIPPQPTGAERHD